MSIPFTAPELRLKAFNCPSCRAFSNFYWSPILVATDRGTMTLSHQAAHCTNCDVWTLWALDGTEKQGVPNARLVYPLVVTAPPPAIDLPENCVSDYEEARHVACASPRAAAALLRLCIQKLCTELGEPGKNINDDIASLVKKGLSRGVQQALDIVRVVGNNSVHPGTMDLNDNQELVRMLFSLVNMIVDTMITQPNALNAMYERLPEGARAAITKRDSADKVG